MTRSRIGELLRQHIPEFAPQTTNGVQVLQGNSFRLSEGALSAFLRWVPKGDRRGETELRYYHSILSETDLRTPRMLATVSTDEGVLGVWEWLEGSDLRHTNRSLLPDAFTLLGQFHVSYKHAGPMESPITLQEYSMTRQLLDAELEILWPFRNSEARPRCRQILAALEAGFPTVNHGDVHPGNIVLADNLLHFVDWGHAHRGLNFTDLDYLWDTRIQDPCPDDWWVISGSEASSSLTAYLRASGVVGVDAAEVIRAVMLWNQLCTHSNAVHNGLEAEAKHCKVLILELLG
jgi:hypothetical protein